VGFTLTLVPVTVPTPLSMLRAAAFAVDQLSVAESPTVIMAGVSVKLVMLGAATTVTVACAVADAPNEFVAVRV
jgi:hypothetical protein